MKPKSHPNLIYQVTVLYNITKIKVIEYARIRVFTEPYYPV